MDSGDRRHQTAARRRRAWAASLLLALLTAAAYSRCGSLGFLDFDDNGYVTRNHWVQEGFTREGLRWAFTSNTHSAMWHPLTWVSHMLDYKLFGLDPRWHHGENLLWHTANALLLFAALLVLTGALGRAFLVGALFAVHPLHVESVAWVAERKDLLAGFFWGLCLLAYARYVRSRHPAWYAALAGTFALGILAKPTVVMLPAVLLILDFWPLGRHRDGRRGSWARLAGEKLPLVLLSCAGGWAAYAAQAGGFMVGSLTDFPAGLRVANALHSYAAYLAQTIVPHGLQIHYPYPRQGLGAAIVTAAVAALALVTFAAVRLRRSCPALLAGWLWYTTTLLPMIGIVQVAVQARADRYTYLPLTGVFVMIAWGCHGLGGDWRPALRRVAAVTAVAVSAVCAALTWRQVGHWRTTESLFAHTVALDPGNAFARRILAGELEKQGKDAEAAAHLEAALRSEPGNVQAVNMLATLQLRLQRDEEALDTLSAAVARGAADGLTHSNLGVALEKLGRRAEARASYEEALRLQPRLAVAHANLGLLLGRAGDLDAALPHLGEAAQLEPGNTRYRRSYELGLAARARMRR